MKLIVTGLISLMLFGACSVNGKYGDLQKSLSEFVEGKDAIIGVAVIIDGKDTVSVNGDRSFPMLSVYKFPIALALSDKYRREHKSFDDSVKIFSSDLCLDTYSPMTEKLIASGRMVEKDEIALPVNELLAYMLKQSDNNASDIILREIGGPDVVGQLMSSLDVNGVNVRNSEKEMRDDNSLCYVNSSTPLAMVSLMNKFDSEFNDSYSKSIKRIMESCDTGVGRLAKPLISSNAVIGHKTGTGFALPGGRLMAVNDAGYVHLPNGHIYAIAVFIENSGYSMTDTEALIAEISEMVVAHVK